MRPVLQVLALIMAFVVMGGPTWISELVEDDCAEECSDETSCPEEGCADCSVICSSCPRTHAVLPQSAVLTPGAVEVATVAHDPRERLPISPHGEGVFHPPRPTA